MLSTEQVIGTLKYMEDVAYSWNLNGEVFGRPVEEIENVCCAAASMLARQVPRKMLREEVMALEWNTVVWLQDRNKDRVIPAIVTKRGTGEVSIEFAISDRLLCVGYSDYGQRWICWTSKPSEVQQREVAWNG